MGGLFALDTLVGRLKAYVERRDLKPEAFACWSRPCSAGSCRAATPHG